MSHPSMSDAAATAARVSRLDRSVVCGKAQAAARRMALQHGGDFRGHLGRCTSVAWAEQWRHIEERIEMTDSVLAAVEELAAEGRRHRAEAAASVCRVLAERAGAA